MSKIKVLFVDHTPVVGGAQLALASHIKYLDRKRFTPYLLIDKASKYQSIYKGSRVKVFKISFDRLKIINPKAAVRLKESINQYQKVVKEIQPDLVVANTTRALILSALAKKNYLLIAQIRDYDYPKWLMKLIRKRVDKFLFVSRSIKNYYGLPGEVVYLGVDLKIKERKIAPNKEGIVVGFVGRLVDWKGPLFLLKAFKKVDDPKMKLYFFGTGKGQPGDVEGKLKREIRRAKLEDRVKIKGFVSDLATIYQSLDIFTLPSIKPEPFSTTLIQASLAKLPIAATDNGGTPEFIRNDKNGILVSPNDADELSRALIRLSSDKKLAQRLASQAYKDAQEFTEEKITRKLEGIYAHCINS